MRMTTVTATAAPTALVSERSDSVMAAVWPSRFRRSPRTSAAIRNAITRANTMAAVQNMSCHSEWIDEAALPAGASTDCTMSPDRIDEQISNRFAMAQRLVSGYFGCTKSDHLDRKEDSWTSTH